MSSPKSSMDGLAHRKIEDARSTSAVAHRKRRQTHPWNRKEVEEVRPPTHERPEIFHGRPRSSKDRGRPLDERSRSSKKTADASMEPERSGRSSPSHS